MAGALAGLLLSTSTRIAHPFAAVLTLSVLGALIGYGSGDRTINGTLTLRLLMAGVWLAVGISDPTPLGIVALTFGSVFAGLSIIDARRSVRLERAQMRLAELHSARRRHDI